MTSAAETETSDRYLQTARRWFTDGWRGDLAMADRIFSEDLRTNGIHVGVAGPVGRIRERLAGFPDLTTSIQDMFVSGRKLAVTLIWRGTRTGLCSVVIDHVTLARTAVRRSLCPVRGFMASGSLWTVTQQASM